mmetsp:Transcript_2301/g.3475  ORF Transcript_2301/g.3475 Transcript_2301/m.3475 type:complete len:258 (-) Transcript_2301:91-864(-)|eukprot:CAMPEP_0197236072 /NCGR_PEP_ID=MMETSP1429-20130617/3332_1 /TAXON_ID=49237 /ORGANISM="Chaetoceros  sp., Strain UNC1202" /LENGTH=257 /DNA_ID=CAMNT_0042694817 /DNA_START=107 /DNA_END=880 /DNA_ORIENTATION=+
MADIYFWKDSITNEIEQVQSILETAPHKTDELEKSAALDQAEKKLRSAKGNARTFRMEIRLLSDATERSRHERELTHYEQSISTLTAQIKEIRSDTSRDQLFLGANNDVAGAEPDPYADGDALLNDAGRLQDKTQQSLGNTKTMVEESKLVGMQTVDELQRQREQINQIDNDVMRMEDNLNRADKLIKTFGKRMATDKLIQCFACVNVLLIVGVIVYSIVKGGLKGDEEEAGAPESPVDNSGSSTSSTRMLRGFGLS